MFLLAFSFLAFFLNNVFGSDLISGPISFGEGEYKNFSITKDLKKALNNNSRLSFKVINPSSENKLFYLVFEDNQSTGYWSKLNFKSTLVPGENELTFNLRRNVGERGSARHQRTINYSSLKKVFVSVNPEKSSNFNGKFLIKDVKLFTPTEIVAFNGFRAFAFGKEFSEEVPKVFERITPETTYGKNHPHGFTQIDLWRVNDAGIMPKWLSETVGVKKATFRVTLPPGEYNYRLVWDELGYWDVPFWKKRMLSINGVPERREVRGQISDFLDDYLSLMGEPSSKDHPYDFYLSKVFKPIVGSIKVKKNYVDFNFVGDASGVGLNYLMIWLKKKQSKAKKLLARLDQEAKESFNQKYRQVKYKQDEIKKVQLGFHDSSSKMLPGKKCSGEKKARIISAPNGRFSFDFCLNSASNEKIDIQLSNLVSNKGEISSKALELYEYIYRYKSIDLNHETYQMVPDTLKKVSSAGVSLNKHKTKYFHFKINGGGFSPGKYKGKIKVTQGKITQELPVELVVLNKSYPKVSIKAGVIGLSPFPKTYFSSPEVESVDLSYHQQAKLKLKEIGLSTFTDIPSPSLNYNKSMSSFNLMNQNSDDFLMNSDVKKVFFYDGAFPSKYLNDHLRNAGQSKDSFFKNLRNELEKFKAKHNDKEFIYLYSDEATGYRNAVKEDAEKIANIKKIFPSLKVGGFGNLYDWNKGKSLYELWDFGLYADIPNTSYINKLKNLKQNFGVYNICAEPQEHLEFCFGPMLFNLENNGVNYYFEWHASAIHNYPGFDLDGREADIAFFYPSKSGEIVVTRRYVQAGYGMEIYNKLKLLEVYLKSRKAPGLKEQKAQRWLTRISKQSIFPIKEYKEASKHTVSKVKKTLNNFLEEFVSY